MRIFSLFPFAKKFVVQTNQAQSGLLIDAAPFSVFAEGIHLERDGCALATIQRFNRIIARRPHLLAVIPRLYISRTETGWLANNHPIPFSGIYSVAGYHGLRRLLKSVIARARPDVAHASFRPHQLKAA